MSSNDSLASGDVAFGEPDAEARKRFAQSRSEREALIREPGPTWREWFYTQALRWWLGLAFLVLDTWIAAGWVEVSGWLPLVGSLITAGYLEFLLWQYLWHPYDPELRGKFRRSWHHPFEVGRWSPDREKVLKAEWGPGEGGVPDPQEFL